MSCICLSHTPLSDVDWATGVPKRYVMLRCPSSVPFVNPPAEVEGGVQDEPDRWPNNSECLNMSLEDAAPSWIICVNPQIKLNSSAHYLTCLFHLFVFFLMSKVQSYLYQTAYSFVPNVVNNTVSAFVCFTHQRMIKEKTASVFFLSTFCYCFNSFFLSLCADGAAYLMSTLRPASVRKARSH